SPRKNASATSRPTSPPSNTARVWASPSCSRLSAIMEVGYRWKANQAAGRHSVSNCRMAHLLIVDDDANTLASLARAFRMAGHEDTVCDSAGRALELVKSQSFDMMLSDVVMPGKDGPSLLEDLRSLGVQLPGVMIPGQAN